MSFFEKLKFTELGISGIQSVDEMTIYPIVGPNHEEIGRPTSLRFKKTSNYGTMVFENDDSKPIIVPANIMARGPSAQDHAMSGAGIVPAKSSKSFDTACCIQQRQGGLLSEKDIEHDILPIGLRKAFLDPKFRNEKNMSRLWPSISKWLEGMSLKERGAAHLRYFYGDPEVKKNLEEFAAEFEPVQNQIGAIVMFCGVPVGIEIMPSADHWMTYWKYLIRGCYGAELLRLKMIGKLKSSILQLPEIPSGSKPDDVEKFLDSYINGAIKDIVPALDTLNVVTKKTIGSGAGMSLDLIQVGQGGGDLITISQTPVYLSVVL
jgi:hypothetical protein